MRNDHFFNKAWDLLRPQEHFQGLENTKQKTRFFKALQEPCYWNLHRNILWNLQELNRMRRGNFSDITHHEIDRIVRLRVGIFPHTSCLCRWKSRRPGYRSREPVKIIVSVLEGVTADQTIFLWLRSHHLAISEAARTWRLFVSCGLRRPSTTLENGRIGELLKTLKKKTQHTEKHKSASEPQNGL